VRGCICVCPERIKVDPKERGEKCMAGINKGWVMETRTPGQQLPSWSEEKVLRKRRERKTPIIAA
jgi:hypothetical protein